MLGGTSLKLPFRWQVLVFVGILVTTLVFEIKSQRFSGATISLRSERNVSRSHSQPGPSTDNSANEGDIFWKAVSSAFHGGLPGALAMFVQVVTLMWLRTTVNFQYSHGVSTFVAISRLYQDGGIRRFYSGISFALLLGPLSRFGDTAANSGVLSFFSGINQTAPIPLAFQIVVGSFLAACWRMFLSPLDCLKTTLQVNGNVGIPKLIEKIRKHGIGVLYHGAMGLGTATLVGHFPWFLTYNYLNSSLFVPERLGYRLLRNGFIGFCCSVNADICTNSIRVLKTLRQTSNESLTYMSAASKVVRDDGLVGLFTRGLRTRLMANGLQAILFTIVWKYLQERLFSGGGG